MLVNLSEKIGDENAVSDAFLELYDHIEKLREAQNLRKKDINPVQESITQQKVFTKLQTWLKKNGAKIEGLSIYPTQAEGGGVFADKDFKAEENLVSIPRNVILSTEVLSTHPVMKKILEDPIVSKIQSVQLAMLLLYERFNDKSFWKTYIQSLPKTHTTIYNWKLGDIELLHGTSAYFEAITTICTAFRLYYNCRMIIYTHDLMNLSLFTYDNFIWALSVVYTRQNKIPIVDGIPPEAMKKIIENQQGLNDDVLQDRDLIERLQRQNTLCLIPGFDMFNHADAEEITSQYLYDKNAIVLSAGRDFKKGEQAYMLYGHRSNNELLLFQGFVPEKNSRNFITIPIGIAQNDKLKDKKIELLSQFGYSFNGNMVRLTLQEDQIPPPTMLFIRAAVVNDESYLSMSSFESSLRDNKAITYDNELKALQILQLRCTDTLRKIAIVPTSIEEIQSNASLSKTQKLANLYIRSHRLILTRTIEIIEQKKKKLQNKIEKKQKPKN